MQENMVAFVEKILSLAGPHEPVVKEIDGYTYITGDAKRLPDPVAKNMDVNSLTAVVDFCSSQLEDGRKYVIHIESERRVRLISAMDRKDRSREELVVATRPYDTFNFGNKFPQETFVVAMQTQFVQDKTTAMLVDLSSAVKEENGVSAVDDGVAQNVTVQKGISLKGNAKVPNPVTLAPFRTFAEVVQPAGPFVFRVHDGIRFSLTEADGGVWKIEAVENIRAFFMDKLKGLIEAGTVAIIG